MHWGSSPINRAMQWRRGRRGRAGRLERGHCQVGCGDALTLGWAFASRRGIARSRPAGGVAAGGMRPRFPFQGAPGAWQGRRVRAAQRPAALPTRPGPSRRGVGAPTTSAPLRAGPRGGPGGPQLGWAAQQPGRLPPAAPVQARGSGSASADGRRPRSESPAPTGKPGGPAPSAGACLRPCSPGLGRRAPRPSDGPSPRDTRAGALLGGALPVRGPLKPASAPETLAGKDTPASLLVTNSQARGP